MKIIRHGKVQTALMEGTCRECDCKVEVERIETKELIDRDTTEGMATRYVRCPECRTDFLWVIPKIPSGWKS